MRKFISVLLVLCMCISMCNVSVLASETSVNVDDLVSISDDSTFYDASYCKISDDGYYSITPETSGDITITNLSPATHDAYVVISGEKTKYSNLDVAGGSVFGPFIYDSEGNLIDSGLLFYTNTDYLNQALKEGALSVTDSFTLNLYDVLKEVSELSGVNDFYGDISTSADSLILSEVKLGVLLISKIDNNNCSKSRVYLFEDSVGTIDKHFVALYEDAMTFNPDKNPCKDAEKYIDISMNSREYEGSVSFGDSFFYKTFEPYVTFSTLNVGEEITVTNVSENKDVKLLICLDALLSEGGAYKLDLNNRFSFNAEGDLKEARILHSDIVSKEITADYWYRELGNVIQDGEGISVLQLGAGESFTFTLPKNKVDVLWSLIVYYYCSDFSSDDYYYNPLFEGVSMQGIFVDGENNGSGNLEKPDDCIMVYEPFDDVKPTDYYYDAVMWAVDNGITKGTSETEFSPNESCTQGQILTFLWRANGSPLVEGKYAWIDDTTYYANALKWAYKRGIIDATLNPGAPCKRIDVVKYLYDLEDIYDYNFDGAEAMTDLGNYSTQAVGWAIGRGITTGTSATTFSPDEICTRGQIVTFLYRAYAN